MPRQPCAIVRRRLRLRRLPGVEPILSVEGGRRGGGQGGGAEGRGEAERGHQGRDSGHARE